MWQTELKIQHFNINYFFCVRVRNFSSKYPTNKKLFSKLSDKQIFNLISCFIFVFIDIDYRWNYCMKFQGTIVYRNIQRRMRLINFGIQIQSRIRIYNDIRISISKQYLSPFSILQCQNHVNFQRMLNNI